MKFSVMSALIGATNSVPIMNLIQSTASKDECDHMSAMCNVDQLAQIDATNLIQLGDDDHSIGTHVNNIKENHVAHFGKDAEKINAENKKILDTQKTCLDFVTTHPEHPEVCNWCHESW